MISVSKVIERAAADEQRATLAGWREYRGLLESANAGKLTQAEAQRLGALAAELKITPAQAEAHAVALHEFALIAVKQAEADAAEQALQELRPQIDAWATRRAEAIRLLDTEGAPLLLQAGMLEHAKSTALNRVESLTGRGEGRFPLLFGIDLTPKPLPPRLTPIEAEENQRRMEVSRIMQTILADFRDGAAPPKSRAKFTDDGQNAITALQQYAILPENPRLYSPEGGWKAMAERLPESLRTADPRKKTVLARARQKHRDKLAFSEMSDEGRYLLSIGVSFGWLNHDYTIAAGNEADDVSDEAGEIVYASSAADVKG